MARGDGGGLRRPAPSRTDLRNGGQVAAHPHLDLAVQGGPGIRPQREVLHHPGRVQRPSSRHKHGQVGAGVAGTSDGAVELIGCPTHQLITKLDRLGAIDRQHKLVERTEIVDVEPLYAAFGPHLPVTARQRHGGGENGSHQIVQVGLHCCRPLRAGRATGNGCGGDLIVHIPDDSVV